MLKAIVLISAFNSSSLLLSKNMSHFITNFFYLLSNKWYHVVDCAHEGEKRQRRHKETAWECSGCFSFLSEASLNEDGDRHTYFPQFETTCKLLKMELPISNRLLLAFSPSLFFFCIISNVCTQGQRDTSEIILPSYCSLTNWVFHANNNGKRIGAWLPLHHRVQDFQYTLIYIVI